MAAQLGRLLGDPASVRAQLTPDLHTSYDMALSVQELAGDGSATEKDRRVSLRTEEAVEKARAARSAAAVIAAEEHAALYAAADADGDDFGLLGSLDLDNLEEAQPLIDGFLVKESIVRLYGPPKHFKSFVMLDMAGCVGSGIPWHGNKTAQSKVLYVVAEGVRGIRRRVRAWEALNKRSMVGVHFYPKAVQLGERKDVSTLIRTAKRGGYEFIILDTQARCTVGMEENSASEMGVVVAALDVLKEVTGACVALVHHSGAAGGRARGSTAILGALDAEFEVKAKKHEMTVELITRAQKDLAEASEIEMDLITPGPGLALAVKARPAGQWYSATAADSAPLSDQQGQILRALAEFSSVGASPSTITTELGWDTKQRGTVQKVLGRLVERGMIHRENGNRYVITRQGTQKLDAISRQLPDHT